MNLLFLLIFSFLLASLHTIDKSNRIENLCPPSAVTEYIYTRTLRCPRLEPAGLIASPFPGQPLSMAKLIMLRYVHIPFLSVSIPRLFILFFAAAAPYSPSHYYHETFLGIEADVFLFYSIIWNRIKEDHSRHQLAAVFHPCLQPDRG